MSLLYAAYGCSLHPLRLTARDAANRSLIERLKKVSGLFSQKKGVRFIFPGRLNKPDTFF